MYRFDYEPMITTGTVFEYFDNNRFLKLEYTVNMYNFDDFEYLIEGLEKAGIIKSLRRSRDYQIEFTINSQEFRQEAVGKTNIFTNPIIIDISFCNPDDIIQFIKELDTTFRIFLT